MDLRLQSDSETDVAGLQMEDIDNEKLNAITLAPNEYIIVKFVSRKVMHRYAGKT